MPKGIPRGYPDGFLKCRARGNIHHYDEFAPIDVPAGWHNDRGMWVEALRCSDCGYERLRLISKATGAVYGVHRTPSEGYSFSADEKPTTQDFRLMQYKRAQRRGKPSGSRRNR